MFQAKPQCYTCSLVHTTLLVYVHGSSELNTHLNSHFECTCCQSESTKKLNTCNHQHLFCFYRGVKTRESNIFHNFVAFITVFIVITLGGQITDEEGSDKGTQSKVY